MQTHVRDRNDTWRFDDVEVRGRANEVRRGDRTIGVEPKAHAVLMVLLSRAGEAVAREALLDTVWGHRHVTPSVLNRIVAQLRRALGDDAANPKYIQTLHGRGYRFMVTPERVVPDGASQHASEHDLPATTADGDGGDAGEHRGAPTRPASTHSHHHRNR
jgi:DNA-binding winged helix-turn-helix (wHTH) protein